MTLPVQIVSTPLADLGPSLRKKWRRLAESLHLNPSLSPEWTAVVARSHPTSSCCNLIQAYDGDELMAIWPMVTEKIQSIGVPLKALGTIANFVSYHQVPISRLDAATSLDILADEARKTRAAVIQLSAVPDESTFAKYLQRVDNNSDFLIHRLRGEASPYLPLNTTWEALLASKSKKFRYKIRKRAELLGEDNSLTMRWFTHHESITELLRAMRIVEEHSWKKDAGVSLFERDHERAYHELLLPFLASQDALLANVLFHQEAPIAFNLCCIWNGWVGQLKTSFDTRYAEFSPGSTVIDTAIERAIDLNAREFDFLGDTDPHKLSWTKSVRYHSDYFLYLKSNPKGRILGTLKSAKNRLAVDH